MAPSEGGGFAEFMKRKAIGCYPVPDSLSWEEVALVEPLAVSVHGVRLGELKGGEVVTVPRVREHRTDRDRGSQGTGSWQGDRVREV